MGVKCLRRTTVRILCIIAIIGLFIGLIPCVYAAEPTWPRIKENSFKFKRSIGEDTWADEWIVELPVADSIGNVSQQTVTFTSKNIHIINNPELVTTYGGQITNNKVGTIILDYGDMLILPPDNHPTLTKNYEVECYVEANYEPVNYIDLTDGFYPNVRFFTELNNRQNRFNYDIVVKGNNFIGSYPDTWEFNVQNKSFTINSDEISNPSSYSIEDKIIPTWGTTLDNKIIDLSSGLAEISLTNAVGDQRIYHIKTQTTVEESWLLTIPNKSGYNLALLKSNNTIIAENVALNTAEAAGQFSINAGERVEVEIDPIEDNIGMIIDSISIMKGETELDNSVTGNTISFTMPNGNVCVGPVSFKEQSAGPAWPRIKEEGGFVFKDSEGEDKWTVEFGVANTQNGATAIQDVTFTSADITVINNDELVPVSEGSTQYKTGTIVLNYGDRLLLDPVSQAILNKTDFDVVFEGEGRYNPAASVDLTSGTALNFRMLLDPESNAIRYLYDFKVVGNSLIGHYPETWTYDAATKTFTIVSDTYIPEYKAYSIVNRLTPTWGTIMDQGIVDFSQGRVEVTLSQGAVSEKYSIILEMPWQLTIPGRSGYNIAVLKAEGKTIIGETSLETLVGSLKYDIKCGDNVSLTIIPYGDEEGKIIDSITLVKEDGTEIAEKVVADNTVSFIMPSDNVRIESVSFKDTDSPVFAITTSSSLYTSTNTMGSISTLIDGIDAAEAHVGDEVFVSACPNEHSVYEFVFSHWETEDIELTDGQRTNDSISFVMPEKKINLKAVFEKKGVEVSFQANPGNAIGSIGTFAISQDIQISEIMSQNGIAANDLYKSGSTVSFIPTDFNSAYIFDGYSVTDQASNAIPYEIGSWQNVIFTIPEIGVTSINVVAKFKAKEFSSITAEANDASMGTVTATVNGSAVGAAVLQDETVTVKAAPAARYKFVSWDIAYADGSAIDFEMSDRTSNPATFVVPDNGKDIVVTGNFELDPEQMSTECHMLSVELFDGDTKYIAAKEGTAYTITVPRGTDPAAVSGMVLKLTSSDYAAIKKSGDTANWPDEGKACGMVLDTPATFTVTAEDGKTTQDYTITITQAKSSEKEITAVRLLDSSKAVIAEGALSGDIWTIVIPPETDPALVAGIGSSTDVFMQIEYAGASVAQAGGYDDAGQTSWNTGTILCGISVNSQKTFTVKAEDGSTKDYTIAISYTAPDAPTLTNGSAERTGEKTAVVRFTSNEAGRYFYQVVDKGAAANVDTTKNGSTAAAGQNTINLSGLTADARDIYIVVKNTSGVDSVPLKVEIPAYEQSGPSGGEYHISISAPPGGTLVTNVTTANKGDSVFVSATPNDGYRMVEGSLSYTLNVAGGETVKIIGNRFQMPECDVTITCQWEESSSGGGSETPQEPGITSFIVQGVSGAISKNSDTEYTITLLMPHGTDVTKLAPVISTYGNVSVSPASGRVQDFSSPVIYTVTLEDGTKLQYKVTVYVSAGSKADQMWDKLADPHNQIFWWDYALQQQIRGKYPKYW